MIAENLKPWQILLRDEAFEGTMDSRFSRLLQIIQEIREDPRQDLQGLLSRIGISKTQFYKDRAKLEEVGFSFGYSQKHGFKITQDQLTPVGHLTLSEILVLMFSLKNLHACGDGHLSAKALAVGRKLASALGEPLQSQVLESFDEEVLDQGYGVKSAIYAALERAVSEGERVSILYQTSRDWTRNWVLADPERLYFVQRSLYLYAHCPEKEPRHRSFRVSRISDVRPTGIKVSLDNRDPDFTQKLNNAFSAFLGLETTSVVLKISGRSARYVSENFWHKSQKIERLGSSGIKFSMDVAEPREVIWWARQFGDEMEVLEPQWLKEEVEGQKLRIPAEMRG